MKKLFAVVLLASTAYACGGGKKASTTPDKPATSQEGSAVGGSSYGGAVDARPAGAPTDPVVPTPASPSANPCASH